MPTKCIDADADDDDDFQIDLYETQMSTRTHARSLTHSLKTLKQ